MSISFPAARAPTPALTSAVQPLPALPHPAVTSASLAMKLRHTYKVVQDNASGALRDPRFARPHREALWRAATLLANTRPRGTDDDTLRAPLHALRVFIAEFGPHRDSGDERLQTRILAGHAADRPGLCRLLQVVLAAAGMGRVTPVLDVVVDGVHPGRRGVTAQTDSFDRAR